MNRRRHGNQSKRQRLECKINTNTTNHLQNTIHGLENQFSFTGIKISVFIRFSNLTSASQLQSLFWKFVTNNYLTLNNTYIQIFYK